MKLGYRFVAYGFILLALFTEQMSRFGPSTAMIGGMVKKNCSDPSDTGKYCWSEKIQALVIGAFFYGYVFQFPIVGIAARFGFTLVVRIFLILSGVIMLTYPLMASVSPYLLIVGQIIRGLGAGVLIAYQFDMVRKWALPSEAKYLISCNGAIQMFGVGSGPFVAGLTASSIGWEYYFYISGIFFLVILTVSLVLVPSSPHRCRFMSEKELRLYAAQKQEEQKYSNKFAGWRDILRRRYLWAFSVAHIGFNFVAYNLYTTFPFYLDQIQNVSITILSWSIMYFGFGMGVSMILLSKIFQFVDTKTSWLKSRITFTMLPFLVHTVMYLIIPSIDHLAVLFAVTLVIVILCGTLYSGSYFTVNYEVDPVNSPKILSVFNSFGQLPGFFGPLVMVFLTYTDPKTPNYDDVLRSRWNRYFYIMASAPMVSFLALLGAYLLKPSEWKLHPTLEKNNVLKNPTADFDSRKDCTELQTNVQTEE